MSAPSLTIAVVKLLLELEPDIIPAPNPTTAAADKDPLISVDIWAELDTKVLPNSVSAVVTLVEKLALAGVNEPLMSVDICAELDNAPLKIPLKSLATILVLELISPLAVKLPVTFTPVLWVDSFSLPE